MSPSSVLVTKNRKDGNDEEEEEEKDDDDGDNDQMGIRDEISLLTNSNYEIEKRLKGNLVKRKDIYEETNDWSKLLILLVVLI